MADSSHAVTIRLLGPFAVAVGGRPVSDAAWGSRKARQLVALLALAPDRRLAVEQLLDALWPDLDPDAARRACYQALYLARRALDPERRGVLTIARQVITLAAPGGVTVDLDAFREAAARARREGTVAAHETALALHTGEILPDERYEDWAIVPREEARRLHDGLALDLARLHAARGDWDAACARLEGIVAQDPANEEAHVALMRAHAEAGRRGRALAQFRLLRAALRRDLDAEPEPASQQLYAAILAGRPAPGAGGDAAGTGETSGPRHNLPAPTTAIIGRERALAGLRDDLRAARLVTLLGTGGIGKTRLALAAGHALRDGFPGGVWLLELAAMRDGALLAPALAATLGVRERAGERLLTTIIAALRERACLLILDNCEHLVAACADLVAAVLAGCPEVRVLATSREALRVAGELCRRVPPLEVPAAPEEGEAPPDLAAFAANPAVRLFLDRARLARPAFALTVANAGAIMAICRRLDGLPLAIELAAARVAILAPDQLAARLDDALRVLTGGPRTAPARQQTLRAALDWSHALLGDDERTLLARLAIFAGGWSLAAAEHVCAPGDGDGAGETLDLLAALVEKSLVLVEDGGGQAELRYRLLEPIRQYAAGRLDALGATDELRGRHAAYFLTRAEESAPLLYGPYQESWLHALAAETENCRAALRRLATRERWAEYARLAVALHRFWFTRGRHAEGRIWLAAAERAIAEAPPASPLRALGPAVALASGTLSWPGGDLATAEAHFGAALAGESAPSPVVARAHSGLGIVAMIRGDYAAALAHFEAGLALARGLDDRWLCAVFLNNLGLVTMWQGDAAVARVHQEENLALCREAGDAIGIASALANLCEIAHSQGDDPAVDAYATEALGRFTALGDRRGMAVARNNLAVARAGRGDLVAAARHGEAALALYTAVAYPAGIALSLHILGEVAQAGGDFASARARYRESLERRAALGNRRDVVLGLERLATLATTVGDARPALAFLGASDGLRRADALRRTARDETVRAETLAAARAALGEAACADALAEGAAWSYAEALDRARAYLADPPRDGTPG